MAEPTGSYTFDGLIIRVAELIGVASYGSAGTGIAAIPTDTHDLDKCKRTVNDAIKMFIADAPLNGWYWMRRIMSITFDTAGTGSTNIDSDPARYLLAENFGGDVIGKIAYAKDSNRGHLIDWCSEGHIRSLKESVEQTGYPRKAAIRPYAPSGSVLGSGSTTATTRRFELIVDPAPTAADTIEFPYRLTFNELSSGTDLHPAGFRFDDSILAACKAQAEMDFDDIAAGWVEYYNRKALPNAYKIDARSYPRKLTGKHILERTWENVTFTANGVEIDV